MTTKFTMKFNYGSSGFSESWYSIQSLPIASQQGLQGIFLALQQARMAMSGARVQFAGWSITDPANPRAGVSGYDGTTQPVLQGNAADNPTSGWLVNCKAIGNQTRNLFLRGLQDQDIVQSTTGTNFTVPGPLLDAFNNYKGILISQGFQLRVVSRKNAAGTNTQFIPQIAPSTNGNGITLTGPTAFAPIAPSTVPPNVIVAGFKKPLSYINGTYVVGSGWTVNVGNNIVLLGKSVSTTNAAAYLGGATIRAQTFNYQSLLSAKLMFPRTRHIGRPFFGEHGRHSRR